MSGAIKRGALIVFEGCDRSGKTTQVQRLVTRLTDEGARVRYHSFYNILINRVPYRYGTVGT